MASQERAGPPVVGLGQLFLLRHQHSHLQGSGNGALACTDPAQQHSELPWVSRHWYYLRTNVCGLFNSNDHIHFMQYFPSFPT